MTWIVYSQTVGFGLSLNKIFGGDYERLVELKKKYDLQNVFESSVDFVMMYF